MGAYGHGLRHRAGLVCRRRKAVPSVRPATACRGRGSDRAVGHLLMPGNAMNVQVIDPSATVLFWQTLARAFMPPMDAVVARAFVADLPDDLADLAEGLGLQAEADISALREQALHFVGPQALLLEYARLFLPPVGTVTLNLSRYVDGGGGLCMDALEAAYYA